MVAVLLVLLGPGLFAAGVSEASNTTVSRTWEWDEGRDFELRGQVEFTVVPGPRLRVTVEASPALFDQLSVNHGWGKTSVIVESGLRGPREPGKVTVRIETPEIRRLEVADSTGSVAPLGLARLAAWEGSSVTVAGHVSPLEIEASWGSSVILEGEFPMVSARIDSRAWVDARKADVETAQVWVRQGSYLGGPTGVGTAVLKEGGRLDADLLPWTVTED